MMMSFNDVFYILAVAIILMLPITFFMVRVRHSASDPH